MDLDISCINKALTIAGEHASVFGKQSNKRLEVLSRDLCRFSPGCSSQWETSYSGPEFELFSPEVIYYLQINILSSWDKLVWCLVPGLMTQDQESSFSVLSPYLRSFGNYHMAALWAVEASWAYSGILVIGGVSSPIKHPGASSNLTFSTVFDHPTEGLINSV